MTEPETNPPELTPAQEEVRRRLAAARHTEPVPTEVAARLDRVLVGLADEREPAPAPAPVIHLAAHRRRRAARLLVAAAAVVVAGIGFGQLGGFSSLDGNGSADQASSAERDTVQPANGSGQQPSTPEFAGESPGPQATPDDEALRRLPVVRPDSFRADASDAAKKTSSSMALDQLKGLLAACPSAQQGEVAVPVAYEGSLATLIYRAPVADRQRVDLYRCNADGTADLVRTAVIPQP